MGDAPAPLIEVTDLGKTFRTPRGVRQTALDGVSFTIAKGETFGLAGLSGAGKSTLGRVIMNLIPPSSGDVQFEGRSITGLDARGRKDLWRRMQMVFQNPLVSMNPRRTARSMLEMPLRSFGMGNATQRRERAYELLELVGLSTRHAEYYPHEFSGGQCQRLGIARAIASNPSFIFLDEPVSALDVSIQAQVLNLLKELQEELHLTYLVVANNLNVARFVSDRLAIMDAGRIVEMRPTEDIFAAPEHDRTRELLGAILSLDAYEEGGEGEDENGDEEADDAQAVQPS